MFQSEKIIKAKQVLKEAGYVMHFWHKQDIVNIAENLGIYLTEKEISDIMSKLEHKTGADIGINNDTIEAYIDEIKEWKLTDPSCKQYGRQLSKTRFEFKENRIINPETKETQHYQSEIDLENYTDKEIIDALDAFGHELNEVSDWIKAECLFELE